MSPERKEGEEISHDVEGRVRWGKRAAGFLIFRKDGRVLLALRSADVMDPGVWGIPGGRVEPGETELDGAAGEVEEELGKLPPFKIVDKPHVYRSGGFTYTTFIVEIRDEDADRWKPELNWENDDWGWFRLNKLPKPLHENVARVLRRYRRR